MIDVLLALDCFSFTCQKNQLLSSSCMIFSHVLMFGVLSALSFKHLKILTSQLVRILSLNFERILHEILSLDYKEAKKKHLDAN